jgi:corrinoid protein of di/trimethylamine methyltransferase
MTNRQRMLMAIRGEMADVIPFAPRLDLWYLSNLHGGTLPKKYADKTADDIARAEGWALHKVIPEYQDKQKPHGNLHWALGILSYKETVFNFEFSQDIDIEVIKEGDRTRIVYHTPVGSVSTSVISTKEMRKAGISHFYIEEHVLKGPKDYRVVGYLFENLRITTDFEPFVRWTQTVGQDGVAFSMAQRAASPTHHIQKHFIDATQFYFHYNDYQKEMQQLSESVGHFFEQTLRIVADSPAEVVYWGANFDDMITYPTYFEAELMPWISRAADLLGSKGKFVSCHCDGENRGLMDLIHNSGMHIAEAICPYPMTKVTIGEYYHRWSDKLTLYGGIPSTLLLEQSTTDEEFDAYLDSLFEAVAPGNRIILSVADSTPPKARLDRLVRLGERVRTEGSLPLKAGGYSPVSEESIARTSQRITPPQVTDIDFKSVHNDVLKGDHASIVDHVLDLLDRNVPADDILNRGMLPAMEVIGEKFTTGEAFIPEVLLSARAMNKGTMVLEPHIATGQSKAKGRILIGTVKGDLHDIGKNIVITMLRAAGFEVKDLGINVETEAFMRHVKEFQPHILGLSALLTTTMPVMRTVIEALISNDLRDNVKVMVGGAPVNDKFALDIGADAYGRDAGDSVAIAKTLLQDRC